MAADVLLVLGMVLTGCLAAAMGLWAMAWLNRGVAPVLTNSDAPDTRVFLFRGDALLDATDPARQMLDSAVEAGSDWRQLGRILAPGGTSLDQLRRDALTHGTATQITQDATTRVRAVPQDDALRITLDNLPQGEGTVPVDRLSLEAMQHELQTLQTLSCSVPWLIWREGPVGPDGRGPINWANAAYIDLAERHADADIGWPPPHMFDTDPLQDQMDLPRRLAVRDTARAAQDWYICTARRQGDDIVYTAVSAAREVSAQAALGDLRQTLAQTLATLPFGLVIFDKHRTLTMANTRVLQMLELSEAFVASGPDLDEFLDHLRNTRHLPEPRNYRALRGQISRGEGDNGEPGYSATWTLPNGQMLRVSAQVQGDMALVLIFDDVTLDMSLTRRFRAELDLGQSVFDHMEEALAVFDADGVLGLSNAAYNRLWQSDPRTSLGDLTLADAIQRWQGHCAETSVWDDLRRIATEKRRSAWSSGLQLRGGDALRMRVAPLNGGAILVGFRTIRKRARQSGEAAILALPEVGVAS